MTYITILWFLGEKVPRPLWLVPVLSIVVGCLFSFGSWAFGEHKFKSIIRREIKASAKEEGKINPESAT